MQSGALCNLCSLAPANDSGLCDRCTGLLQWVRSYYGDLPDTASAVTTETTFMELGVDSLDYIDWVLEAGLAFDIIISDREAERILTVGAFIKRLSLGGATWGSDRVVSIEKGFLGIRRFEIVPSSPNRSPGAG
jgi:acyl carrier protein